MGSHVRVTGGQLKNSRSLTGHPQVPTCRGPKWWRDRHREESDSFSPSRRRVVVNHKQVSLLLFFHHSAWFSPPFSLRVSEAWETGSKHRSYDSAWPQIKRTGRRRYSLRREEQPQHLVIQIHIHINIWLLPKLASCNMKNFDPLLAVSSVPKMTSNMVRSPADALLSCSAAKSLMDQQFSVLPSWSCRPGCNCLCGIRWNIHHWTNRSIPNLL